MRKFQRKAHIPQNRLTKSTCLNSNDLQNNKQGSLDFSLQELNGDNYQAAFRIIQSLQNKITKTCLLALKQIQLQSICTKVQKARRKKSLMIFLHLQNSFKRQGLESLKKWKRRGQEKIRSCQLVKNWLSRAIRKKKTLFFINNTQLMSQLLKNYQQESTNNRIGENIIQQLQNIMTLHPKRNAKTYEQKIYELYPLLDEFIKKKKKPFKSNACLLIENFKNCIGFYKDMTSAQGSALNKMDEKLLSNLKKLQSQQQSIYKYLTAFKRTIDQQIIICEKQSRPQYQSRKKTLSLIKFLIQMLQKDEAKQSKSTSSKKMSKQSSYSQLQAFNGNQCKMHNQQIEDLNQKIKELQSKIKELEQKQENEKQNKEKQLIITKNQQLLKLSKSIKALSKDNKSKANRLSTLKQQYKRFDAQYFKRKSQQVESRNSLYNELRLSRQKFDQRQSTTSLSKSHSGIKTERSKNQKQSLLKLLFKIIDKAIDLNRGQQADVWQQMKQITNTCKSVEDMHLSLESFVVLFIERHKQNLKSLDLSQSQQKDKKTNGLAKLLDFRSGGWGNSTPRKQQISKSKYNKTVKR